MILFFDRNIGKRIPEALIQLKLPAEIKYHQNHFAADTPDDDWLRAAGAQEWVVISQDLKFHKEAVVSTVLAQHKVGCFYLSGAQAPAWKVARAFLNAFEQVVKVVQSTPKPFVYRIDIQGRLRQKDLRKA